MGMTSELVSADDKPKDKTPAEWHGYWQKEVKAAEQRLGKYYKQGNRIVQRYLDDRDGDTMDSADGSGSTSKINLFNTNVSTLMSMLHGQTPKINVKREHADPDDDEARVAALLFQRILEKDVLPSGEDLQTVLNACLQDRLLPGMGAARVRYDFETSNVKSIDPDSVEPQETEQISDESAPIEYIHWQDMLWGWGRTWKDIPWWGFRAWLSKDEIKARFGEDVAKNIEYKQQSPGSNDSRDELYGPDQKNSVQKAEIWEIWNKKDKKVYFWSDGAELLLDSKPDPLKLDGFWPMPKPMMANLTTTLYRPKADFAIAQDLYNEIDELQSRISLITKAVRVVGVYDQAATDSVGRMLNEGVENDLIPVENWAMFSEKGGLSGVVDWYPVQEVVGVLETLIALRDQAIANLYEVTGMSDIMTGGKTDQYTSDGTQQLKAKFGSVRVQALQDEFARFASELSALKAEVIAKHFTPLSIVKQSSARFLPQSDKQLLEPALQLMKSEDIKWRIEIKPEDVAMADFAQIQNERSQFLGTMANYIQSAQGAVESMGPGSLPVMLEMMKWAMAGFKGSEYLEGMMDKAIDQALEASKKEQEGGQEEPPTPEAIKLQIEQLKMQGAQQKAQMEQQKIQLKAQMDMQTLQAKVEGELAKIRADNEADMTIEQTDAQNELIKINAELQADLTVIRAELGADIQVEEAQSMYAIAEQEVQHENAMTEKSKDAESSANQGAEGA